MLEFVKKNWVQWVVGIVLAIITVTMTDRYAIRRDANKEIQNQLSSKASKDYVDQQDNSMRIYVDKQDENTKDAIKSQTELIKSIDGKLNILIDRDKK
jgi:hypothetical protein